MRWQLSKQNHQSGQMAIFVALIFQVLFLFFAMAINIGLVVHDKINLQNAVDLSAYYAAQRQAEMLNVIAHTNYQVRQSFKLLNWRYYVLGLMGYDQPKHPAQGGTNLRSETTIYPPLVISPTTPGAPALCVTYQPVWQNVSSDNACKDSGFSYPNVEEPKVIAPFNPINILFAAFARETQNQIAQGCTAYAGDNWFFGALIFNSFFEDQLTRKFLIRDLSANLTKKAEDMIDLDGDSVLEGARKTFAKNLTATNHGPDAAPTYEFEMINSLAGVRYDQLFTEMDVFFSLYYQDLEGTSSSCNANIKDISVKPSDAAWNQLAARQGPGGAAILNQLLQQVQAALSISASSNQRLSIGVEKNPWYGVKAKTTPRQMFFPFGEAVQFEAKAIAQPFGGRVGPWYGNTWARGAATSSGAKLQLYPEQVLAGGIMNSAANKKDQVPQYSKYPGDVVGLRSYLAQNSLTTQSGIKTEISAYSAIKQFGENQINDAVAFSVKPGINIRDYEIAAAAPDLFDVTYYSIQPNFGKRYLEKLIRNRNRLGISALGFPRGDLGSRSTDDLRLFSVKDQIAIATGKNAAGNAAGTNYQMPDVPWYVRDRAHLLTSWVHNNTYGEYFDFPTARFGKCEEYEDGKNTQSGVTAPGSCLFGGRTGYSVKIVSPETFRVPLALGGPNSPEGVVLNPPPNGW
jgi:Putative Flp pilus-assembly TadE/G-like